MRVLYVISTLGGGGAESQLCSYATELKKQHPEIEFAICAIKSGGVFEKKLSENGIHYTVLNSTNIVKSVFALRKLLKSYKPDVVHAHMFLSDIVSRYATVFTKCKLVSTHHGLGKWKNKLHIALDKLSKHRVDRFVMVSEQSMQIRLNREKYPKEKTRVIFNGISDRFLTESSKSIENPGSVVVGTIARMTDNKQINLMLDAISEIKIKYPTIRYEIVGEGENYDRLIRQAQELGIEDNVVFWGWQDDVLSITRNWHIFALPSINEDLPVAMLECMAQGIVPVASTVGGIITLLDENRNGVLCDSSDVHSFINAIVWLAENGDKYNEMSENCINIVKNRFLISANVENTLRMYQELFV